MPDLSYGDLVQGSRSQNSSSTNALAIIPITSESSKVKLYKPYCTIGDVKNYISNSDYDDGFYSQAINQASRMVDKITGKSFWYQDFTTKSYIPNKADIFEYTLYLPFPIRSITSVTIDNDEIIKKVNFISITEYEDPRNFYLELEEPDNSDLTQLGGNSFFSGDKTAKIKIKGTFGYKVSSTTQMPTEYIFPPDVRRATTMIAGTLTDQFRKESVDLQGNKSNLLETMIPMDAVKLLKKSKRIIM